MLWFGLVFGPWKHGFTQFDNKVHLKSHLTHLAKHAQKIQITYYMNLNIAIACSKTNKWTQQIKDLYILMVMFFAFQMQIRSTKK
jgi:hypothetical protein